MPGTDPGFEDLKRGQRQLSAKNENKIRAALRRLMASAGYDTYTTAGLTSGRRPRPQIDVYGEITGVDDTDKHQHSWKQVTLNSTNDFVETKGGLSGTTTFQFAQTRDKEKTIAVGTIVCLAPYVNEVSELIWIISGATAAQRLFAVQVAVGALGSTNVPVIDTSPFTCTPPLCGEASVFPKITCAVPVPTSYVAWRLCDTPDNDNKLRTTAPIDRPEPSPYQNKVGQWSDGSEMIVGWSTKAPGCADVAVPATFGRGYGYFGCDGIFVLVRVTEEQSLEITFGFGGAIEYLHHIEFCDEGGSLNIVEHFKCLHFQSGIAIVDEDKCQRIAIPIDPCPPP